MEHCRFPGPGNLYRLPPSKLPFLVGTEFLILFFHSAVLEDHSFLWQMKLSLGSFFYGKGNFLRLNMDAASSSEVSI